MKRNDFFSDLALIAAKEAFDELALIPAAGFFEDCDELAREVVREKERLIRYKARRAVNALKAYRVHKRFVKVMKFDPWEQTKYIPSDVFGDQHARIEEIKSLANRRSRIAWTLWAMYHYWMFDIVSPGSNRYGKRYSAYRRLWYKYEDELAERMRQQRWDEKRERVRARREKRKYVRHKKPDTSGPLRASRVQEVITNIEPLTELESNTDVAHIVGPSLSGGRVLPKSDDSIGGLE